MSPAKISEAMVDAAWAKFDALNDGEGIYRDHMKQVIAAALAAQAPVAGVPETRDAGAWFDMSSAPRNGSGMLLSTPRGVTTGKWLDNSRSSVPWAGWHTGNGPFADAKVQAWRPFPSPPGSAPPVDPYERAAKVADDMWNDAIAQFNLPHQPEVFYERKTAAAEAAHRIAAAIRALKEG